MQIKINKILHKKSKEKFAYVLKIYYICGRKKQHKKKERYFL